MCVKTRTLFRTSPVWLLPVSESIHVAVEQSRTTQVSQNFSGRAAEAQSTQDAGRDAAQIGMFFL